MQKVIFILVVLISGTITVQAQSLKEALYGGKLKMDSNSVLKKTDDIKSRIDTAQRKPVEVPKPVAVTATSMAIDSNKNRTLTIDSAGALTASADGNDKTVVSETPIA